MRRETELARGRERCVRFVSRQELLSTTDALNHTSSNQFDSRFRLVQTTDANGGVTQITLDPAGNRVKLVDPDGNATSWTFSPVNLPLTETNAQGHHDDHVQP